MDEKAFKQRTKGLAIKIVELVAELPSGRVADVLGRQVLRSGTSVGANYRAACRGKSTADMISKLAIVEEEADETLYWLELLVESDLAPADRVNWLWNETDEIIAMTVTSIKTLRRQ